MKAPEDFVHHEGTARPECWVRNEVVDVATVYQDNYGVKDLRRLAKWCTDAADYIEWFVREENIKSTNKAR